MNLLQRLSVPLATLAAAALLASCAQTGSVPSSSAEPVRLRVIAFNDFHGNLEAASLSLQLADPAQPGKTVRTATGGAAALAGTVTALRAGAPHSVVLSGGDMIGASPLASSLFRHESTIEVMNLLGVDVAAPGNHEFDGGLTELLRMLRGGCATNLPDSPSTSCSVQPYAGAKFAVVAANIETAPGTTLFQPFVVKQYGPVKVGFIGATTRTTPSIVSPAGVAGLRFLDEADSINRAAAALKAQGVNTIIVTMHEGGEIGTPEQPGDWNDTRCPNFRGELVDINRRLSADIDLVMSAHTHQGYRCIVDGRPLMSAVSYGRGLSVADLLIDPRTGRVDAARTLSRNLPVFNERTEPAVRERLTAAEPPSFAQALRQAVPSTEIATKVAAYVQLAAPRANREVGRIGGSFDRNGRSDTAAGRLIADAQLAATRDPARGGAQLSLMNPGGVRSDLACRGTPPCPVTYGDTFTMQPFGNGLVVMTLSGAELKTLLEQQRPENRNSAALLNPSTGLRYRWLAKAPEGQRVADLTLNGQPVVAGTDYRVVVNSFMADGGDGYTVLRKGRQRVGGPPDLDALVDFLKTSPSPTAAARIDWVE